MSILYQLLRQSSRIYYKLKHHRGHGIHSPFVFCLINDVIEEKRPYYAYLDICKFIQVATNRTDNDNKEKTHKLLFRLVNRFSPSKILEIGTGDGVSTLYLTAKSDTIECICIGANNNAKDIHQKWNRNIQYIDKLFADNLDRQDFIYVNLMNISLEKDKLCDFLKNIVHIQSTIVIDGIAYNKENQLFWKEVITNDSVRISLDLYDLGILFFDRKYYKQNFKLSF